MKTFEGLNIISILNDRYAEYFGFSDNEVQELAKYYKLEEKYPLIRDWYNRYVFGQTNVYNPWSVIKFIFDLTGNKNVFPLSYWANTSSNSIVKSLIEKSDSKTKQEIELLIEGKTIEKIVYEDITYDEIFENGTPIPNVIGVSDSDKKQVFGSLLMDNLYDEDLKQEGYENIIKYGISFYRKDCIVKLGKSL